MFVAFRCYYCSSSTVTKKLLLLNRHLLQSSSSSRASKSPSSCFLSGVNNTTGSFFFSSDIPPSSSPLTTEPSIDISTFQAKLTTLAPSICKSLRSNGYYATPGPYSVLPQHTIQRMREQSIHLRQMGRFEPSWSEKIDAITGEVTRFNKEGVFACEPDGQDYYDAPDLIVYLSVMLSTLPNLLNSQQQDDEKEEDEVGAESYGLSASSFNAKLAVTSPGGSVYPLHIDNPQGLSVGDTRRLTCILYMNPEYQDGDGGELRIYYCGNDESKSSSSSSATVTNTNDENNNSSETNKKKYTVDDITPEGGRMVLFWSDEIPHEVLPTGPTTTTTTTTAAAAANRSVDDVMQDRYALTVWIPTEYYHTIHNPRSKFANLGVEVFSK